MECPILDTPVFTSVLLGTVVMGVKLFTAVDFPTLAKGAPNTQCHLVKTLSRQPLAEQGI